MATILYIHGFLSSPQSYKARITQAWLAEQRPDINFVCPVLSSYPDEARVTLETELQSLPADDTFLIGSSMGGFWATWLLEQQLAAKAVLVNPAVAPQYLIADRIGVPLHSYYTDDTYQLEPRHQQQLAACDPQVLRFPERYWVMLQTGDETLDYRQAQNKYAGCLQTVEDGGDHSFAGFENYLPKIMEFFSS